VTVYSLSSGKIKNAILAAYHTLDKAPEGLSEDELRVWFRCRELMYREACQEIDLAIGKIELQELRKLKRERERKGAGK
jgi:hypothetical protein